MEVSSAESSGLSSFAFSFCMVLVPFFSMDDALLIL